MIYALTSENLSCAAYPMRRLNQLPSGFICEAKMTNIALRSIDIKVDKQAEWPYCVEIHWQCFQRKYRYRHEDELKLDLIELLELCKDGYTAFIVYNNQHPTGAI
jgi:hypothetical protein